MTYKTQVLSSWFCESKTLTCWVWEPLAVLIVFRPQQLTKSYVLTINGPIGLLMLYIEFVTETSGGFIGKGKKIPSKRIQ